MSPKTNNLSLIILSSVLAILLLALGGYTYFDYRQDLADKAELEAEKIAMQQNLTDLITKYDNVKALNSVMDIHLIEAKQRIVNLLDTIKANEPKLRLLIKYQREFEKLKQEKFTLFRINDSLKNENTKIKNSLEENTIKLEQSEDLRKSLIQKNQKLITIVSASSELSITNVMGTGLKKRISKDKPIPTNKAKRTHSIQTCFMIPENKSSYRERKKIALKLFNPNKEQLGDPIITSYKGSKIIYSAQKTLNYTNQQVDMCVSITPNEKQIVKGTYSIELYIDNKLKKTSTFSLD